MPNNSSIPHLVGQVVVMGTADEPVVIEVLPVDDLVTFAVFVGAPAAEYIDAHPTTDGQISAKLPVTAGWVANGTDLDRLTDALRLVRAQLH